ncbi:hypothetical protein KUTeg_002288 [Tegillarca granosa]|uniref:Uncharacterized protein n=1 Tax=Tegillarca granosa TaxID=220873 RepID=A0ABQ9FVB8_TEGGR|nr:hypothetical protein KUTeg_002288 [Tegillarca granosa]
MKKKKEEMVIGGKQGLKLVTERTGEILLVGEDLIQTETELMDYKEGDLIETRVVALEPANRGMMKTKPEIIEEVTKKEESPPRPPENKDKNNTEKVTDKVQKENTEKKKDEASKKKTEEKPTENTDKVLPQREQKTKDKVKQKQQQQTKENSNSNSEQIKKSASAEKTVTSTTKTNEKVSKSSSKKASQDSAKSVKLKDNHSAETNIDPQTAAAPKSVPKKVSEQEALDRLKEAAENMVLAAMTAENNPGSQSSPEAAQQQQEQLKVLQQQFMLQQQIMQQQLFMRHLHMQQLQQVMSQLQDNEQFKSLSPLQQQQIAMQLLMKQSQQIQSMPVDPQKLSPRSSTEAIPGSNTPPLTSDHPSFHRSMSQPTNLSHTPPEDASIWGSVNPPVGAGAWSQPTSVWDLGRPTGASPELEKQLINQEMQRQQEIQKQQQEALRKLQQEQLANIQIQRQQELQRQQMLALQQQQQLQQQKSWSSQM